MLLAVYESAFGALRARGLSDAWSFGLLGTAVLSSTAWLLCGSLAIVDHFDLLRSRKIEPRWPPQQLYAKAAIGNFISVLTYPASLWLAYHWLTWADAMTLYGPMEPVYVFACKLAFQFVVLDALFYWSHRLMHVPWFYVRFHKQHHEFHETVGFAHAYAGFVESLFVNSLPFVGSIVAVRQVSAGPMHAVWVLVYFAIRLYETIDAHSGYRLPLSPWDKLPLSGGSERHYFHHKVNTGCYGILGFWDRVCGTESSFHEWRQKQSKPAKQS